MRSTTQGSCPVTEKRVAGSLHRSGKAVKFTTNLNLADTLSSVCNPSLALKVTKIRGFGRRRQSWLSLQKLDCKSSFTT